MRGEGSWVRGLVQGVEGLRPLWLFIEGIEGITFNPLPTATTATTAIRVTQIIMAFYRRDYLQPPSY